MCGIFGFIGSDDQLISDDEIRLIADRMIHRGPDDEGMIKGESWAIGMRRLSIIDLEGGHQPISNELENIHLVANGEIYNFKELRHDLIELGYEFKTGSDVEVILHLYQEYGCEGIQKLNGMFAFALYDETKAMLWIARDRLGIKPLYYGWTEGGFGFSSELTGLARVLGSKLCQKAIVDFLGYSYVPAPATIFQGIKSYCEEMVLIDNEGKFNTYWKSSRSDMWRDGVEAAIDRLDELLQDSVKLQLVSDVPVGVFLSGGVDRMQLHRMLQSILMGHLLIPSHHFEGKEGSITYLP